MYSDAESHFERILALVEKCPAELRANCFEILLKGYVERELVRSSHDSSGGAEVRASMGVGGARSDTEDRAPGAGVGNAQHVVGGVKGREDGGESQVPSALIGRFRNTAKRLGVQLDALEALFDFTADPVDFHALHVTGKGPADKTRKVAMLVAARSYLTTGVWVADWKEIKSQCVNQNCYDRGNFGTFLKKGQGTVFSKVEVGQRLELSGTGIKEAEALLTNLATAE